MKNDVTDMANQLADECIAVKMETGEERLVNEVAQVIGASSQTLEEAFLTAVRTRMALKTAQDFLVQKRAVHHAKD